MIVVLCNFLAGEFDTPWNAAALPSSSDVDAANIQGG